MALLALLNLAKDSGINMLSFPPYCFHKLQPLDLGVFSPFKKRIAKAQTACLAQESPWSHYDSL